MKNFSQRIENINESPLTRWDSEIKKAMENNGNIISLNSGQPDFDVPSVIKEEIVKVANQSDGKRNNSYVLVQGTKEARKVVSLFQKKVFGLDYRPEEIILTNGAKEGIFLSLGALIDPGDEVVLIAPYWSTYQEIINFFGGKSVVISTNKDFHLDIEKIENAVTKKTKAVIINSPNNPSGAVYTKEELGQLAEIVRRYDLYVISDEVYGTIRYGDMDYCSIASLEGMRNRTVIVNGFSKSFSMTGYRLGYTFSSSEIAEAMLRIKSNSTGNTNSFFQAVIANALLDHFDELVVSYKRMRNEFEKRKNFLCKELDELGVEYANPEGAFYVFAGIPDRLGMNSEEFSKYLLDKLGIAVAPGIFFGKDFDSYIRISFASSMEDIREVIRRIKGII